MSVQKIYTGPGNVFEVGQVGTITTTTITNIFHSTEKRSQIAFNVISSEPPFIGSQTELQLLDEAIQRNGNNYIASIESHITVVSGLGGIGKTQLVREYLNDTQIKSKYDNNVIWINADREESIVETFKLLANDILTISMVGGNGTEKNIPSIIRDVYEYFCGKKMLVVFDNVESMESIKKFLLLGGNTRPYFLITSRSRNWHRAIAVIHLIEWQPNEAIDFVSAIIDNDRENAEDVKLLVEDLQYFPLALRQATSYIFHREDTITNYRTTYRKQKKKLLDSKLFQNSVGEYAETTFTTWNITMTSIKQDINFGSLAMKILNTLAYFHADNISRASLIHLTDAEKESTGRAIGKYFIQLVVSEVFGLPAMNHTQNARNKSPSVDKEELLESAVGLLIKYSMITSQERQTKLNIHRVVQDVIKVSLKMKGEEKNVLRSALLLIEKLMKRVQHTTHAMSVFEHSLEYADLVREFQELPNTILMNLITNSMKEDALIFVNRFMRKFEMILGPEHPILEKIAFQLRYVNAYNISRSLFINETGHKMYEELYKMRVHELGPHDVDTMMVKFEIGQIFLRMERVHEAFSILEGVNQQIELSLGSAHPETINTGEIIAISYNQSGLYAEALQRLTILYEKKKCLFGESSTKTLFTLNAIGGVLLRQQKYSEALEKFRKICEDNVELDEVHETRLRAMENMAHANNKLGKYDEAIEIYKDVLDKKTRALGESHPDTLSTLTDFGVILLDQWKLVESIEIFQKICTDSSKHEEDSETTLIAMKNMGVAFSRIGDYVQAEKIYNDVLSKRKKTLGENHPDYLVALNDIGELFSLQERFADALLIFEEIYKNQSVLGEESKIIVVSMNNIAYVHSQLGNNDKALELYKQAHSYRVRTIGENHPATMEVLLEIAGVLENMGNDTDALHIYETINEKAMELGEDNLIVRVASRQTGLAYGRSGKYAEGLQILKKIHAKSIDLGECHPATLCAIIDIGLLHIDPNNYIDALKTFYNVYEKAMKISQNNEFVVIATRRLVQSHLALGNYIQSWKLYRISYARNVLILEGSHLENVCEFIGTSVRLAERGKHYEAFLILMDIYVHRSVLDIAEKDSIIGDVRKHLPILYDHVRCIQFIQKHLV